MKKIFAGVIIFITGFVVALILTHGSLEAQPSGDGGDTMAKLNEIVRTQQDIISMINSMKEDIQIIKVRVTQLQ